MRETWYVLEDGTAVHPDEVAPDEAGKLTHKSGAAVAMRGDTPSSRSVDASEDRERQQGKRGKRRDMEADDPLSYKTK